MREVVSPARNLWGEEQKQEGGMWNRIFSPAYKSALKPINAVDKELKKLEYYPAPPDNKVKGVKLDNDIYDWMSVESGKLLKYRFNEIVNSDDYKDPTLPDSARKDMFEKSYKMIFQKTADPYNEA
jgi:hypothetical protein